MSEYAGKTLLFVGGGMEALPGIEKARELGLHVVVSDMNPQAPGLQAADGRLIASTYDVGATLTEARRYNREVRPIDGVMCLATDVPLTVAAVAADLGLPGIPVEVAARAMDKLAMKEKFATDGVSIPWFSAVESAEHLQTLVKERGLPLVLKPVDSRGGRGVQRLTPEVNLVSAYERAIVQSPGGRVMVEQYLPGPQISTESIVLDGICHTPGFADRNYEFIDRYAPHFIENGGTMPSFLPGEARESVRDLVQKAATSLGVTRGVVKGDMVLSDGKPYVIELAARLSGGWFCTHEIPLNVGVDLVLAMIRLSLGLSVEEKALQPQFEQGVALRLIFPEPGRVIAIEGENTARALPGIAMVRLTVNPGDIVRLPTDSNASAGLVIAVADNREEAIRRAEKAVNAITVKTEGL
ncbi:ATP-grasp domain-containing protein [Desulfuromonas sp. CSMB_57]|uniref:ATP-grasp domain-containing protein n=1 Tax=Desulfuromonas sp. CSMB_57 TaxID=2807629 RepID=UPI001CD53B29|nr:ATP-grasp domain-containing protein [Desulfuromonas sp. CSMB_57]